MKKLLFILIVCFSTCACTESGRYAGFCIDGKLVAVYDYKTNNYHPPVSPWLDKIDTEWVEVDPRCRLENDSRWVCH
jgi:hypothetical protein